MSNFLNYIVESDIQPSRTNVMWIKDGVLYYYNKVWKPILAGGISGGGGNGSGGGSGSGGSGNNSPIVYGEGNNSAIISYSDNRALNTNSLALGNNLISYNFAEASFGKYNRSTQSSSKSKATLFSIGNGTSNSNRSNAFEVKENGDVYIQGITSSLQSHLVSILNTISATENALRSEFNSITEDLYGRIAHNSSLIEQTAEMIRLQVQRITELEDGLLIERARIDLLANRITLEVERINSELGNMRAQLELTAEQIKALVENLKKYADGRIDYNYSMIEQTAYSITLLVESIDGKYDSRTGYLEGLIIKNSSEIAMTAQSIALKVDRETFDTLSGIVTENTSAIQMNAENIKSKVSAETFDIFSGEVDTKFTEVNQTVDGIKTTVKDVSGKMTEVEVNVNGLGVKLATAEADIQSLKKQSDGTIDTHFGNEAPTMTNKPAVDWVTTSDKENHVGDLYYNNSTGEAYRFSYNPDNGTYFWVELTDSALIEALNKISKLEEAIDGKVTIFYTTPTNYKYGDLWFVHVDNSKFKAGVLVSAVNMSKDIVVANLNLDHWVLKTNYTTPDELDDAVNNLNDYINDAFKDNVLTEAEIKQITELEKSFAISYKELDDFYSALIITVFATEDEIRTLKNAKSELDYAYDALIKAIKALKDINFATAKKEDIDKKLTTYNNAYNAYLSALEYLCYVAKNIQENAKEELLKPHQYIQHITADGYITPIEKRQLLDLWKKISEEFNTNRGIAVNYKIIKQQGSSYIKNNHYSSDTYYSIYMAYAGAYNNIASIFSTNDPYGFKDLNNTTDISKSNLPYTASQISGLFETYYTALKEFSTMISKITIDITDAHEKVIGKAAALAEQLHPQDNITWADKGVVLSSVIGVQSGGNLKAVLNGSSIPQSSSNEHGDVVFAGGIKNESNWNDATSVIYSDGHVVMRSGEISGDVTIGNAKLSTVVQATAQFDVLSVAKKESNGDVSFIPLFQVNRDNLGKIISVSSVYDLIGNGNITALGELSAGKVTQTASVAEEPVAVASFGGYEVPAFPGDMEEQSYDTTLAEDIQNDPAKYIPIKTINGESLYGDGNIQIQADSNISYESVSSEGVVLGVIYINGEEHKIYAPNNYSWNSITNTPNSISGYGIKDAVSKTGDGAKGLWDISIKGNAGSATSANRAKVADKAQQLVKKTKIFGKEFDGTEDIKGPIEVTSIKIGKATIYWDEENDCLVSDKPINILTPDNLE